MENEPKTGGHVLVPDQADTNVRWGSHGCGSDARYRSAAHARDPSIDDMAQRRISTETEVAANQATSPGDDPSARMMRLGVSGSAGFVRYGMTYRTADQTFSQASGQEQREAWGEWKNGAMAIHSAVGQRNQFDADTTGTRVQQSYNRIDVSLGKPAWPHLALKYAQNAASNTMDPLSLFPQRADHRRVEAAVGYGGTVWEARLASSYGLETDLMNHGAESQVKTQSITASLRPHETLTITPTLGYRAEQQEWSGARIDSPSASLSMNYTQSPRMSFSADGELLWPAIHR